MKKDYKKQIHNAILGEGKTVGEVDISIILDNIILALGEQSEISNTQEKMIDNLNEQIEVLSQRTYDQKIQP